MPKKPSFAQAQLQLQLYELRREAKLRQAREWVMEKYFPDSWEDALRLAPPGSQENAYLRMVVSYWENACQMLNYGLLHEDLFFQTTNEFFVIWDRLKGGIEEARKKYRNPWMWKETEQASKRYEAWVKRHAPAHLDILRQYMQQIRATSRTG